MHDCFVLGTILRDGGREKGDGGGGDLYNRDIAEKISRRGGNLRREGEGKIKENATKRKSE